MTRILLTATFLFLAVLGVQRPEPAAGQDAGKEPKESEWKRLPVIAKTPWYYGGLDRGTPPRQVVLRSAGELLSAIGYRTVTPAALQASGEIARLLGVDEIDWKQNMVVTVTGGVKPTGGYTCTLEYIKVHPDPKQMRAVAVWSHTSPDGAAPIGITNPGSLALVERFDGKIEFIEMKK